MKFQRQIGAFNVVAHCPDDLEHQAQALLDKLAEINQQKSNLKDGTKVEFGWSILTLRGNEDELVVCEPYFSDDPFQNYLPVVDDTLRVITEQIELLNRVGVEGVNPSFQDKVVIAKGSLQANHIYLERKSPEANTHNSGWYIGEVTQDKPEQTDDNFEAVYVYQLLNQRPALMPILALPPGYLVIVNEDIIEAIFNKDNQNIWQ
ncbi:immunity protein Imm33 domain-containing protein [Nostoc sp. NZL]|uniref:immunity protein Imm33 domain-containing protein n=1 Tax=Nostoc sp. NZL TaxID=2650612 RepID=UPI0018C4715E|nr:hypothetical protein [Nostoc sp. NZL]MBG1241065.1 hypothetical protein [Nostoc sp. NZL]